MGDDKNRELHIQNKITSVLNEAKERNNKGDKRGALFALKKKRLYETEIEKIQNVKMTLETQIFHVESSVHNSSTLKVMSDGTRTMKKIHAQTGLDKIDTVLDEIREESEFGQELNTALRQPLDPYMMDDDALLAELEALTTINSSRPMSNTTADTKSVTKHNVNTNSSSNMSVLSLRMPLLPSNKTIMSKNDGEDLKNLELELAAA